MNKNKLSLSNAKIQLIVSMVIFGTIGIFRKYIPLSSPFIAFVRGGIGALFLFLVITIQKKKLSIKSLKNNFIYLILSGAFIGFNWIFLFEAYNYTSVAVATLCYYMAPIIVILLSPLFFKETITSKKAICILFSFIGMVFISGVLNTDSSNDSGTKGIIFGICAATLYAAVIILNKKIKNISPYDKTIYQLGTAALVLFPYILITEDFGKISIDLNTTILLLIVAVFHTGITYYLYFGAIGKLKAQTVALYSYIDPIVAIILSAFILKESFGVFELIGSILILGSTVVSELSESHKK